MMTTYPITHHALTLLQFLVVAAWWSSSEVLSFLLSPPILFPPPPPAVFRPLLPPRASPLPEALELSQYAVPPSAFLTCWILPLPHPPVG